MVFEQPPLAFHLDLTIQGLKIIRRAAQCLCRDHPPAAKRSLLQSRCIVSTHSLRATTATLLLDADVDIRKVQELLGHRHVTTTQIYDKRRRTTKESASHDVPIWR